MLLLPCCAKLPAAPRETTPPITNAAKIRLNFFIFLLPPPSIFRLTLRRGGELRCLNFCNRDANRNYLTRERAERFGRFVYSYQDSAPAAQATTYFARRNALFRANRHDIVHVSDGTSR